MSDRLGFWSTQKVVKRWISHKMLLHEPIIVIVDVRIPFTLLHFTLLYFNWQFRCRNICTQINTVIQIVRLPRNRLFLSCFLWWWERKSKDSNWMMERNNKLQFVTLLIIPGLSAVLDVEFFCECRSLSSLTFQSESKLLQIEVLGFAWTVLVEIVIPALVQMLNGPCFSWCKSLSSVIQNLP
jgi:hypothetical protein